MVSMEQLFNTIFETIEKENRYRTFRQKNHVCIIFDKKKIYSIGVNYKVNEGSIHSEMDAFNKLEYNTKRNPKKLNILVVRVCYKHDSERQNKKYNKFYKPIHYNFSYQNMLISSNQNIKISNLYQQSFDSSSSDDSLSDDSDDLCDFKPKINKEKLIDVNHLINTYENEYRENSCFDGIRFRMSKPCFHCIQHMKQSCLYKNYLLKKVYYTIDINFIYESNLNEISINPHISSFHRSSNWICSNSN